MKLLNTLLALALFAACASPGRQLAQDDNQEQNSREQRQFILSQAGGFAH